MTHRLKPWPRNKFPQTGGLRSSLHPCVGWGHVQKKALLINSIVFLHKLSLVQYNATCYLTLKHWDTVHSCTLHSSGHHTSKSQGARWALLPVKALRKSPSLSVPTFCGLWYSISLSLLLYQSNLCRLHTHVSLIRTFVIWFRVLSNSSKSYL